jgi:hypothetical protein
MVRKSFRTIVGSENPNLAELCLGYEGYLSSSYVRLDIVKEYERVEHLLSLTSNAGMNSRIKVLEREKEALEARLKALEQAQAYSLTALVENAGREFKSEQVKVAVKAALEALKTLQ